MDITSSLIHTESGRAPENGAVIMLRYRITALFLAILMVFQNIPAHAFEGDAWAEFVSGEYKTSTCMVRFLEEGMEIFRLYTKAGQTLDRLPEAHEHEGEVFAGWVVEGQEITNETVIASDMDAVAVYLSSGDEDTEDTDRITDEAAPYMDAVADSDLDPDNAAYVDPETHEIGKPLMAFLTDNVQVSVLYGTVPVGSEAAFIQYTKDEADELVTRYGLAGNRARSGNVTSGYVAFDVSILSPEGKKYTGDGLYEARVELDFDIQDILPVGTRAENVDYRLYHILEDKGTAEELELTVEGHTVSFTTESFSPFVLQYTVDFHYEIDGKEYIFTLPGGGFVLLEQLLEIIGISKEDSNAENSSENVPATQDNNGTFSLNDIPISEATNRFMEDVVKVEFSSPELVWVGKADKDISVGDLKEAEGLKIQYSNELTEEQIAQINAQTIMTGDWVLISLHPFTSEETLTITMKNGDQFLVKVTDAQISTHVITSDGIDYIITVTYGPEAGIPDGAWLEAKELNEGTEEYEEHYNKAISALQGNTDEETFLGYLSDYGLKLVEADEELISFARFFDITIRTDDKIIEPAAPVEVSITYADSIQQESNMQAEVIHFSKDGIEIIEPEIDKVSGMNDSVNGFTFRQSSFSVTGTLLRYTDTIPEGQYIIIRNAGNGNFYALRQNGTPVKISRNSDGVTFPNIDEQCMWQFTKTNGKYFITNVENPYYRMVLYNSIAGNWNQEIVVSSTSNKTAVTFRNPNTQGLRWNSTNNTFYLGAENQGAESFILARVNDNIPAGRGYNLKPSAVTDLGDISAWKDKIANSKIRVDKTASVADYDNRIYRIDLKALSDVTVMTNKIDLELIVDTSRSMYFPATLSAVSNMYFNDGNNNRTINIVMENANKNQVYYFIGDGEKATVYALYYAASGTNLNDYSGAQEWRYVDASYMNPPDASSMNQSDRLNRLVGRNIDDLPASLPNQNRPAGGSRIYTTPDGITRLAYLKEAVRIASEIVYAVDKDNRIGLVTFNNTARVYQNYTNYSQRNQLYSKIDQISLAGGTRQDLGLEKGVDLYNNSAADAQKIAILITDGAPNMQYDDTNNGGNNDLNGQQVPTDTAWEWISQKAADLKGTNSNKVKLYTLGLSMNFVGGNNASHLDALASDEDGIDRSFQAENGLQIVNMIKDLIDTLVYDVTLKAEVTDVLDPAFYPVDQYGNPIEPGTYTDQSGKTYTWEKVTLNEIEHWKVTYNDQDIGRGEKNSDNTIKTPGWQKSIYIKAKEDFLGGNNINTNRGGSGDRVKAMKFVYEDKVTHETKEINAPSNYAWGVFSRPYVNVDELHLTNNSNEWTVYSGTEISPKEQLQILWENVFVKQVIKAEGSKDNHTRIIGSAMKYYNKTDVSDTESPSGSPNVDYAALPVSVYTEGTELDWDAILNALKNRDSVEKTIAYPGYGHNPGTITVKLEKTIIAGTNAINTAPDMHVTDETGTPVETYKITVTYNPQTSVQASVGDTVTGSGEDQVKSENSHTVNVIDRSIQVFKVDENSDPITENVATFSIYRKDIAGDSVNGLPDGAYIKLNDMETSSATGITPEVILSEPMKNADESLTKTYEASTELFQKYYHDETEYYILENEAPTGYVRYDNPIKIALNITDTKTPVITDENGHILLYNWNQTAGVNVVDDPDSVISRPSSTDDSLICITIQNERGAVLPATGGPGTKLLYLFGIMLILLAGAGLIEKKRKRNG